MIAIRKLSWFVLVILTAALTACGDDDNGAPAPGAGGGGGGGGTPQAVELEQLAGTWAGPFDQTVAGEETGGVQTLHFTITGDQVDFLGFADDRTGTVTKASEVSNAFRIEHSGGGGGAPLRGMLVVIPGDTPHMLFVQENGQFAAVQKIAEGATPAAPEYAQTDIDGAWSGLTAKATDGGFSPLLQTTSSASCEAAEATSNCTVTIDETPEITGATKSATGLTIDGTGRWVGSYVETGTARILLTHDKGFAGAMLCEGEFPQTCDFSAWTKGSQ